MVTNVIMVVTTIKRGNVRMAQTPEKKVKDWIKKEILKAFPSTYIYMPVPMGLGKKGVADILLCIKGVFVSIEAKADGGKETKLQKLDGDAVVHAGGIRMLIEGKDEAAISWLIHEVNRRARLLEIASYPKP